MPNVIHHTRTNNMIHVQTNKLMSIVCRQFEFVVVHKTLYYDKFVFLKDNYDDGTHELSCFHLNCCVLNMENVKHSFKGYD